MVRITFHVKTRKNSWKFRQYLTLLCRSKGKTLLLQSKVVNFLITFSEIELTEMGRVSSYSLEIDSPTQPPRHPCRSAGTFLTFFFFLILLVSSDFSGCLHSSRAEFSTFGLLFCIPECVLFFFLVCVRGGGSMPTYRPPLTQ